MTGRVYRDYQRDRVGWFFGLTGLQLGLLTAGSLPVFWAAHVGWWAGAFAGLVSWVGLLALVVVPVRGRSAVGWATASLLHTAAHLTGRTRWSSRLADGQPGDVDMPDLPAPLDALRVHEVSTRTLGAASQGLAVVEDASRRTWTVVARLQHSGLDWLTSEERDQRGAGLAALLDGACRTELVSEVQILVRVSPQSGAEREHWLAQDRDPTSSINTADVDGAQLARTVHDDLHRHLTLAAVMTETFLTLIVPDARLRRQARHDRRSGSGALDARLRLLAATATEVGQFAAAYVGVDDVRWLGSAALAEACRTGFHLDTETVLADARATARPGQVVPGGTDVEVGVPWAAAGPAHAEARPRSYAHDGWESASVSVLLPPRGAILGALAPVLTPGVVGERRCLLVAFPVMTATVADRVTASREWAADLGDGLRTRAGVRPRAKTRADQTTARGVDAKLVAGAALCRPYAIATTTIPSTDLSCTGSEGAGSDASVSEATRRLEASVRRAGYAAQRLDLAHDTAFAAGCVPLGHTLTRTGGTA